MLNRHYNPTLGKLLQRDPIRYSGGDNMYAFGGGDPINHVDPTGLDAPLGYDDINTYEVAALISRGGVSFSGKGAEVLSGAYAALKKSGLFSSLLNQIESNLAPTTQISFGSFEESDVGAGTSWQAGRAKIVVNQEAFVSFGESQEALIAMVGVYLIHELTHVAQYLQGLGGEDFANESQAYRNQFLYLSSVQGAVGNLVKSEGNEIVKTLSSRSREFYTNRPEFNVWLINKYKTVFPKNMPMPQADLN